MNVLLAPQALTLWDVADTPDEHGWVQETVPVQVWAGVGNVQDQLPDHDPQAVDRGGDGPTAPFHQRTAVAYLPLGAPAAPGQHLSDPDGTTWRVERVRPVSDPLGGPLGVLVLDCREVLP